MHDDAACAPAAVANLGVLTRDVGGYRSCFPQLAVLGPQGHQAGHRLSVACAVTSMRPNGP